MQQPQSGLTVQMRTEMRAYLRAQALEQALKQAQAQMQLRLWQQVREWEQARQVQRVQHAWPGLQVQQVQQVQLVQQALALAQALAQQREQVASVRAWAEAQAEADRVTYVEVLADLKLTDIIYSIEPNSRLHLAHELWPSCHKYRWFFQIIAPITRLPPELLHQILLVIVDNASDPPFVLMQVSKFWYTIVTGIWASLKLGTTTPRNAITSKLERNQWFLDVSVDTEIDRRDLTTSEGAYQAIFATIEATSRWRSFVVETFPAKADLPEHLVNRGLQQCSHPVMSRLRTFKIKRPCEMSPLLERLLRILGTTASGSQRSRCSKSELPGTHFPNFRVQGDMILPT